MKILLITSVLPWPLRRNGGAQRTELLRRALLTHGQVDILAVGGKELFEEGSGQAEDEEKLRTAGVLQCVCLSEECYTPEFRYLGPFGKVAQTLFKYRQSYEPDCFASKQFDEILAKHGPYDVIVSRYLSPGMKVGLSRVRGTPKLLDFDDVDWNTFKSSVEHKPWRGLRGKLTQYLVYRNLKNTCVRALNIFDGVWVTCEEDSRDVPQESDILPNISFNSTFEVVTESNIVRNNKTILFVGDLQFPPNREGLDRFLAKVWPHVRDRVRGAELWIVGRGLDTSKKDEWSSQSGVTVLGFVDDLKKIYMATAFTVVPVYFGGGTKIKVLESLAYGRTVVLPRKASRGYSSLISEFPAVACVDSDEDFVNTCVELLKSPEDCVKMAVYGMDIIRQKFSFDIFSTSVSKLINKVFPGDAST